MYRMARAILFIVFIILAVIAGFSSVALAEDCTVSETNDSEIVKISEMDSNVEYNVTIDKKADCTRIDITKYDSTTWPVRVFLYVDGERISRVNTGLDPGDSWNTTWEFSEKYDVTRDTHSVEVLTTGPDLEAEIEKDFDLADPDIPAQRITDVDLVEDVNDDGERITMAIVEFENPSPHAHMGEVFAHTKETHGSGDLALVPLEEETATSEIVLEEDPDSTIEGEIRYNSEGVNQDEGVRDQVWFRGEVGGDVTVQRQEFEPAEYPGEDDAYRYDYDGSLLEHIPPSEQLAAGVLIGGVLAIGIGRRFWN